MNNIEINNLRKKIRIFEYNNALSQIFKNNDDINLNIKLNGFGLLLVKKDNFYEILFDKNHKKQLQQSEQSGLPTVKQQAGLISINNIKKTLIKKKTYDNLAGKIFYNYQLYNLKKLIILKSDEKKDSVIINEEITLIYDEKLIINFEKELNICSELKLYKKKNDILTTLNNLRNLSEMNMETHNESYKKYDCYNLSIVFPSIIISGLSGVISFVASSDIVDSNIKTYLSLSVGILAIITTFIQSIGNSLNYKGKMEAHNIATEEYDYINTILNFEIKNPNKSVNNTNDFYNEIKNSILDIKKKCNYTIPYDIQQKYEKNKLNENFRKIKYNILNDAFSKKANIIKKQINNNELKLKMDKINSKMSYIIPINS